MRKCHPSPPPRAKKDSIKGGVTLSDFMKNVVAEALRGKKTPSTKKENKIHVTSSSPELTNNSTNQGSLDSIIRPNYQNKNVEKRLSVLNKTKNESMSNSNTKPAEVTKPSTTFVEDSISSLRKVSLSQGKSEVQSPRMHHQPASDKAQFLGSTKDGTSVWFYPTVHSHLTQMFHRSISGYSVVVVGSKSCYPSQLLLLNDLLNSYPDLKYHLTWNKGNNQPFTLELYDTNTIRLEKTAKDIYQHFSKRSLKSTDAYQVSSPSAWLSKQLGITKSVETAGIVEGLSYHNYLLLLDQYFKGGNDYSIAFQVEDNYLLITGNMQQVSDALVNFKKLADRL